MTSRARASGHSRRVALLALLAPAACGAPATAIVDGQVMARPTFDFTGDAYEVRHRRAHPRPGVPSGGLRAPGGDITGLACGMNMDFDVAHRGDHIQIVGALDGLYGSAIAVRDRDGARVITGNLGNLGVDLTLKAEELTGHVGLRVLAAVRDGPDLRGHIRTPGIVNLTDGGPGALPLLIRGRSALWALPPADQALILATVLTCYWSVRDTGVPTGFEIRFGGPAGARPSGTSSLYRKGY